MEYYNQYTNPYKKTPDSDKKFESEIAFVRTNDDFESNIKSYEMYYIKYQNGKFGYYTPYTLKYNTVHEEYMRDRNFYLDKYKEIISEIQYMKRYYTYIYVIKDIVNPQLEGKILPFFHGLKIKQKIDDNMELLFEKTFELNIRLSSGFPNYDYSKFTDNDFKIESKGLVINAPHPPICLATLDRTYKLKKLMNSIKNPQL
jgi:hypothetical protein